MPQIQPGWAICEFNPVQPKSAVQMEDRRTETQIFGTPYWRARFKTAWLDYESFGLMDAMMMVLGDESYVLEAYDVFRPRPMRATQAVPDGAVSSFPTATSSNLTGLPAGLTLVPGDYIEFRESELLRSLHRVVSPVTVSAGGAATVSFRYAVDRQHFGPGAVARLERASCLMSIDPGSYNASKSWADRAPEFSATEVFYS